MTDKKEIRDQYKNREITGGVYAVKNTQSGKILLESTADLQGAQNRFEFSVKTGSPAFVKLQRDWNAGNFTFEVLDPLTKKDTQSDKEFSDDIAALKEIWTEKLSGTPMY
ncbi:MAG: GIY-YIG nuclease family protein [Oscillospiraceae bacterium]|jgi:hypothetical protein|nr:GIY-YIG nuclease family protein [Oscillospiraceae bacterium]